MMTLRSLALGLSPALVLAVAGAPAAFASAVHADGRTTLAADFQPGQPEQPVTIAERGEGLYAVSFRGGTLGQLVDALTDPSRSDHPVNVILRREDRDLGVGPFRVIDVTLPVALSAALEGGLDEDPSQTHGQLTIAAQDELAGSEPIYTINVMRSRRPGTAGGGSDAGGPAAAGASDPERTTAVFSLSGLSGAERAMMAAAESALAGGEDAPAILLHEDSGVLILQNATPEQIVLMQDLIDQTRVSMEARRGEEMMNARRFAPLEDRIRDEELRLIESETLMDAAERRLVEARETNGPESPVFAAAQGRFFEAETEVLRNRARLEGLLDQLARERGREDLTDDREYRLRNREIDARIAESRARQAEAEDRYEDVVYVFEQRRHADQAYGIITNMRGRQLWNYRRCEIVPVNNRYELRIRAHPYFHRHYRGVCDTVRGW